MNNITRDLKAFMVDQLHSGRYNSEYELLAAVSRILNPEALREFRNAWLRREIAKADEGGPSIAAPEAFEQARQAVRDK